MITFPLEGRATLAWAETEAACPHPDSRENIGRHHLGLRSCFYQRLPGVGGVRDHKAELEEPLWTQEETVLHQDRREGVQRTGASGLKRPPGLDQPGLIYPPAALNLTLLPDRRLWWHLESPGLPHRAQRFPQASLVQTPSTTDHTPQKANPKDSPSRHWPLKKTFCSSRNFSSFSEEEKFSSRDTALHFRIFFGTRAGGQEKEEKRRFPISSSH